MKILFVCKHNCFRSRIAEEYFKKINKNKKIEAISRGFIMGGCPDRVQKEVANKILGINIEKRGPLPISIPAMVWADKIIVVAKDIPKEMFNYQIMRIKNKVVIWKIPDEQRQRIKNIQGIIAEIKTKVDELNQTLGKNNGTGKRI